VASVLDGCGLVQFLINWVWLDFLMGVVNFFKDGCGQTRKTFYWVWSALDVCGTTVTPILNHPAPAGGIFAACFVAAVSALCLRHWPWLPGKDNLRYPKRVLPDQHGHPTGHVRPVALSRLQEGEFLGDPIS